MMQDANENIPAMAHTTWPPMSTARDAGNRAYCAAVAQVTPAASDASRFMAGLLAAESVVWGE